MAGLTLAFVCVGFAPRFIVVVALATGMLGSMMRAFIAAEMTSLLPKQGTIDDLSKIITVCGAIAFAGGLYGGLRFAGKACSTGSAKCFLLASKKGKQNRFPAASRDGGFGAPFLCFRTDVLLCAGGLWRCSDYRVRGPSHPTFGGFSICIWALSASRFLLQRPTAWLRSIRRPRW